MKNLVSGMLLLVIMSHVSIAQKTTRENQFEGYVITSDMVKSDVAIEVEDIHQPWSFQENIKYFDKVLLTGARVKRELKKLCIPGEIIEYGFAGRKFVYVNYYVKGNEELLTSTLSKIKGDKNTDYFAEVIKEGKVSLLRFYQPPVIAEEDNYNEELMKEYIEASSMGYDILVARPGQKAQSIEDVGFKGFFEDCDFVVKKYEAERYKMKPSKGLKALLKSDRLSGIKLETAARSILADYDAHCAK